MYINNDILNILIGFFTALLLFALFFAWFYQKVEYESRALRTRVLEKEQALQTLNLSLSTYKERLAQTVAQKSQSRQEFENMAHSILKHNTQTLSEHNSQSLVDIINPFKEHIKSFHDRVENYYTSEAKERYALSREIHQLQELNLKISQDAVNLTQALKGNNKIQGDWGEMILERVLESSGLHKDREYSTQTTYKDKDGASFRPDVIVHLPKNRDIIIDAKVSLLAYERYFHAEGVKDEHLKAFSDSLSSHVTQLSQKSYQKLEGIESLDFVLLFIPIEGAYMLAYEKEKALFQKAYENNIMIVSPSTLIAVLRVIENAWRFEYQNKNAKVIAQKAGDLYDKFAAFVGEMQKINVSLSKAQVSYDDAFKKLSSGKGNLMNRAKELKALEGVVHKKELGEV